MFRIAKLITACRRIAATFALAGFVAGTVGVPVVRPIRSDKDRSQPFPCQDHQCGCASAEQCWRSCCCFTNREKIAWAEKNGVTLPAYVAIAAAREAPKKLAQCCSAQPAKPCCEHAGTCGDFEPSCEHPEEHASSGQRLMLDFVMSIQARRCQGQAELWLALSAVTPPPAKIEVHLEPAVSGHVFWFAAMYPGVALSPATPPPRA